MVAASFLAYMSIIVPELSCKLRCLLFFYPSPQKGITFQFPSSFITPGSQLLKNTYQLPTTHPHKATQEILKARMKGIRVVYKCVSSLLSPPFSKQSMPLASSLKRSRKSCHHPLLALGLGNRQWGFYKGIHVSVTFGSSGREDVYCSGLEYLWFSQVCATWRQSLNLLEPQAACLWNGDNNRLSIGRWSILNAGHWAWHVVIISAW